jgi:hypothetical protein
MLDSACSVSIRASQSRQTLIELQSTIRAPVGFDNSRVNLLLSIS